MSVDTRREAASRAQTHFEHARAASALITDCSSCAVVIAAPQTYPEMCKAGVSTAIHARCLPHPQCAITMVTTGALGVMIRVWRQLGALRVPPFETFPGESSPEDDRQLRLVGLSRADRWPPALPVPKASRSPIACTWFAAHGLPHMVWFRGVWFRGV